MANVTAWQRVNAELKRRGKGIQWLADQAGWKIQRVQNWSKRGVPQEVFPEIAMVLNKSIDWVAGRATRASDVGKLTDVELRLVLAFRKAAQDNPDAQADPSSLLEIARDAAGKRRR